MPCKHKKPLYNIGYFNNAFFSFANTLKTCLSKNAGKNLLKNTVSFPLRGHYKGTFAVLDAIGYNNGYLFGGHHFVFFQRAFALLYCHFYQARYCGYLMR
jgi:hypothetical protein